MTELLTTAEYAAIAADLQLLPQRLHRRRLPSGGLGQDLRRPTNPATGEHTGRGRRLRRARMSTSPSPRPSAAFDDGRWRQLHAGRAQSDVLLKFAKLLEEQPPRAGGPGEPRQRQAGPRMPDGRRARHDPHHPLARRADRQDLRQHRAGRRPTRWRMVVREPIGVVGLRAALELPAADAGLEDRAGAGRRAARSS